MDLKAKNKYDVKIADSLPSKGRFYEVKKDGALMGYFPSATTILQAYPQGYGLKQWLADQDGIGEADYKLDKAGKQGTNVHVAIDRKLKGETLYRDETTASGDKGYHIIEWHKINCFMQFLEDYKPKLIASEIPLISEKHGYSGTADFLCEIDGRVVLADWKTSSYLHKNYLLQFAAYAQAVEEMYGIEIDATMGVQLGSNTKRGYSIKQADKTGKIPGKETWPEQFETFLSVKNTWHFESGVPAGGEFAPILNYPNEL